ncbi:MAG: beta-phosphoglucomutase [Spirochaetales bacterium]|jgi:beta-phosphoglucomutase|nr:beta-phosphoglucomutase [Spirochaetales bacterium]
MMNSNPWIFTEQEDHESSLAKRESLFSLGNGFLGFRGFYEEREPVYHPGVFINGFYEIEAIPYGEKAYGFAEFNQTMIDIPDARFVRIYIDDEPVSITKGTIHAHTRVLDMQEGTIRRFLDWESPTGLRVRIRWEFLVSYQYQSFGALRVSAEPVVGRQIKIVSSIAQPSLRTVDANDPRVRASTGTASFVQSPFRQADDIALPAAGRFSTQKSGKLLFCGAVHPEISGEQSAVNTSLENTVPSIVCTSQKGKKLTVTKIVVYASGDTANEEQTEKDFTALLRKASSLTFQGLKQKQKQTLDKLWESSFISIPSDPYLEKAIRFNMFQLFQSAGKDGKTSLAAKGLTGGGYEGHYFWDTEIYGLPFFTFTQPKTARALLAYRISLIPRARERAEQLNQKGILFPWRTINGLEASAYFPAGTAQYHINADIVYSLMLYLQVTGDRSIMEEGGAELLFETARFWYDLGFFSDRRNGAFCIHEVTGPDDYTSLVNNNIYTNLMAQYNLDQAERFHQSARKENPEFITAMDEQLGLTAEEVSGWRTAAEKMLLPFDKRSGIHPQDDAFLDRERWDFAACPKDKYPLLLHFHPLVIYRFQVIKQADVVLAHVLQPDAFPWYEKVRDYRYYEDLTTGDSSLSACMQGIMAVESGELDKGLSYMRKTALMDLDDYHGNAKDGLHTAAMAGSWLSLVYGFAGLRCSGGLLKFSPNVHKSLPEYTFRICCQTARIEVSVTKETTTYRHLHGGSAALLHYGQTVTLSPDGDDVAVPTIPAFAGAVFDLDGVITSTDQQHYQAWKRLADELSMDFDEEKNQQLRGVSRIGSLEIIGRYNQRTFTDEQLQEYTDRKNRYYRDSLQELTADALLPGFTELCSQLRSRGIKIGVASASRNAPFILEKLGITSMIDAVAPVEEVVAGKPDPEVFVRCADLLQVPRQACAGFEDAVVGVEAVHRAGMKCVGVGEIVRDLHCDRHITDLSEIDYKSLEDLWKQSSVKE